MTDRREDEHPHAALAARSAPAWPAAILAALLIGFGAAACGGGETRSGGAAAEGAPTGGDAPGEGGAPASAGVVTPEAGGHGDGAPAGAAPPASGEPNRREVVLFFLRADEDALGPERRKIFLTESIADQAKQIVSELIGGPREEGFLPTIPRRTTVLGLYLDRSGTAYLDLSEEFVALHPGGSAEEMATIFSIVDSLIYNLPEIKRVRFLVTGEERDTLKSHLDLRRAYLKDMSIVRLEDGG